MLDYLSIDGYGILSFWSASWRRRIWYY